ncbi:MAG TPA: response regulator [Burkholderiales bacterium]|nr:response regulator [Burkholderiales bacterium]
MQACISVVDDDALVLRSLDRLLRSAGFAVRTFPSSQAFLADPEADPGCVVIDLSLPGLGGLELQQALARSADPRPVVFITGRGDIASSVAAMKAGAIDFLVKPFDEQALLTAVRSAVEKDRAARGVREELSLIVGRLAALTPREREVLAGVVEGKLNKQIAAELGTAEKTVKVHRARMMRKMGVASLAGLVRAWTAIRHTDAASAP